MLQRVSRPRWLVGKPPASSIPPAAGHDVPKHGSWCCRDMEMPQITFTHCARIQAAMEATQQRFFERVELAGEGELDKIRGLLEEALERRLQDAAPDELTEEDRQQLCAASVDIIAQLRDLVVFAEGDDAAAAAAASAPAPTARTQLTPAAVGGSASLTLRSPLLPPLSPPPADAEVAALEAEVEAAARRVAELRSSMQAQLQEQLAAKLAACRPSAELEPVAAGGEAAQEQQGQQQQGNEDAGEAGAAAETLAPAGEQQAEAAAAAEQQQAAAAPASEEQPQPMNAERAPAEEQDQQEAAAAAPIPLSPQPGELQQRLASAAGRMPALRARLEAATDRLQRVLAAVAADINRPPPNTVEKAVLGKTPGRPAAITETAPAAGGENDEPRVSPLVEKALESGQISTRRRMARDVQPLPFPQPE
ncbi:hypothetical protein ABPG75_009686 [Micractinium tetrahymenae]